MNGTNKLDIQLLSTYDHIGGKHRSLHSSALVD